MIRLLNENSMKKIYPLLLACSLFTGCLTSCNEELSPCGPDITATTHFRPDGPYLLKENGTLRMIQTKENLTMLDTLYKDQSQLFSFVVRSEENKPLFTVKLRNDWNNFKRPQWKDETQYDKTFIVSDPHGRFDLLSKILQVGNVIDEQYNWKFGANHLAIVGDVFDRGNDVLPLFWLIYKLEQEAQTAGGKVTFVLGNHEEMNMRNNLKYVYPKYTFMANFFQRDYSTFWDENSILGSWLHSKNTIQVVGDNLFVHAGLSEDFIKRTETVPEINELVSKSISLSDAERKKQFPEVASFLYGDYGPLWYRGMIKTSSADKPISTDNVKLLIKRYGVKRIIVGHTENSKVKYFYDKMVYGVDVNHPDANKDGETRALIINGNTINSINDAGELKSVSKG